MNARISFGQYGYKRIFVLVAAWVPAFAALAQEQEQEPASPQAVSPQRLQQLLLPATTRPEPATSLLASARPAVAAPPRYELTAPAPCPGSRPAPNPAADTVAAPTVRYRSALRLDVGGILASTLVNAALGNGGPLLPLLVSYERQLGSRVSVVGEALLNGGHSAERKAGLSVQGRYYVRPHRSGPGLAGFYGAPVVAFRTVKLAGRYEPTQQRRFVAAGALVGWQGAFKSGSRLFLDVSAGLMSWQHVGQDKFSASPYSNGYQTGQKAYYDTHKTDFDGRLGLGFRF